MTDGIHLAREAALSDPAGAALMKKAPRWFSGADKWPTILGLALIGISIILEHPMVLGYQPEPNVSDQVHSIIFSWHNLIKFISEVGIAFLIAGIVSTFIEINAKREQNDRFSSFMNDISRETVESIYKIKHSPEYVRAVIGTCFESPLVREDYSILYEINELDPEIVLRHGIDKDRFVQVDATIRYRARNISAENDTFPTGYGIPVRSGALADLSRITHLEIGGVAKTPDQIQEMLTNHQHGDAHEKMYEFSVDLVSGASTEVSVRLSLIKELSDNDAFGFRRPTDGANITLVDRTGKLVLGITPRTSAALKTERQPEIGKSAEWSIDGPILPFDSVILWWRTPMDDGVASHEIHEPSQTQPLGNP